MSVRLSLLLAVSLALSACSLPFSAAPTATAPPAPTSAPPADTATPAPEPTDEPAPTEAAEPTNTPAPEVEPTATSEPTADNGLQQAECWFEIPDGVEVECGFLSVPENRAEPNGTEIDLAVAIFKSTSANPEPDPIVYLEGGPGGNALQQVPLAFTDRFATFLDTRDFIMFDQRGTGYSRPSFGCDEYTKLAFDTLDQELTTEESTELFVEALTQCHERLAQSGADFSQYNSMTSAADLVDLRNALGYDEWNLYGISYGTRLALTAMREYPEGIRSVILDSTRPTQADETSTPADIDRALEQLFAGCAADEDCNSSYPNLKQTFYDLVDRLNETPATGQATNPMDGQVYDIVLNGDSLLGVIAQALYITDVIPLLPKAIYAASEGLDYGLLIRLALNSALQNEYISYGMFFAVRCNEEVVFNTPEEISEADDSFPQQGGVFDLGYFNDLCPVFEAGSAPEIENEPVTSDIPALVLAGQYDPATPPDDGRDAAQTLSNGYFFEFPGLGHGVSIDGDCPLDITKAFLDDPSSEPDSACIAQMSGPDFVVINAEIELEPLESDQFGFSSVVPEGWVEVGPGIYARSEQSDIAILQLAFPGGIESTLQLLSSRLGLEGEQQPVEERETDTLTWSIYELTVQGLPADLALAEEGDKTFIVLLISDPVERESLYNQVFIPALDAFTPQ